MKIQTKTLALLAVAGGMLASGYLIGPAPGATTTGAAVAQATPAPAKLAPAPQPASKVKMMRPPVPLLVSGHDQYFVSAPADAVATDTQTAAATLGTTAATGDKPGDKLGDKPLDGRDEANFAAKAAIEQDGYRNVRALVKIADGTWRGRAMRGSTEISVTVDANGSVSAD
jgi:hypothetical protein